MIRTRTRSMFLGALVGVFAPISAAPAALPAIFDRVPADAVAVLTTRPLGEVDRDVSQLLGSVELPAIATPSELLRRIGLGEAIDLTKPAAIALMPGDLEADMPPAVLLLPVTNFGEMAAALGGVADGDLVRFEIETGEILFARPGQGGYAVIGPVREIVAAVDARGGNLAAHQASVGAVGDSIFSRSHAAILIKKPLLEMLNQQALVGMNERIDELAEFAPADQADDLVAQAQRMRDLLAAFSRDGRGLVLGMSAGATGVGMDFSMDFEPASEMGKLFTARGDSRGLLKALPRQPFILAYAGDYSTALGRRVMQAMGDWKLDVFMPGLGGGAMGELLGHVRGQSFAVFESQGGLMGGLLANSAAYIAVDNAAETMKSVRAFMKDAVQAGGPMKIAYQENATQIDGVNTDSWSATPVPPADADPFAGAMAQQIMMSLFGPGGAGGYYAPGERGLYTTMGRNSLLLSACFAAEKGQNSLADDRGLSMVAERLPEGRTMEMYLGLHSVLQQGLQLAAMFGMPVALDLPPALPPIGMGVTTDQSAARLGVFVPAPVIKTLGGLAQQAQGLMDQGAGDRNRGAPPF